MHSRSLLTIVLFAASAACAAKAPSTAEGEAPRPGSSRRDVITQEDLNRDPTLRAQSVLEVVRALRPHFLTDRTGGISSPAMDPSAGNTHASVDNGRIVDLSELNQMRANDVIEIRFLTAAQAMTKFGTAARQGPIILVTTASK